MSERRFYTFSITIVFLLARIFVFPLLPAYVLVLGVYLSARRFWLTVGLFGLLTDLLSGLPLGTWGLSHLPLIIVTIILLRASQLTLQIPIIALLGLVVTVAGSSVTSWILGESLSYPSRFLLLVVFGWSLLATFVFRVIRSNYLDLELRVRY